MKKELAKRRYVDPAEIAYDYASLGDKQQTFAWLDKAAAEKSAAWSRSRPCARWSSGTAIHAMLRC